MNIVRLSTLSLTIILFSLGALMLPVNSTLAHHCKGGHRGSPECPVGGGNDFATYSVTITGAVSGTSGGTNWRGGFTGKNSIGLNAATGGPFTAENNVGQLTDLSFFTMSSPLGPFSGMRGENCFGTTDAFLGQATVKKGKRGRAEGQFWFRGHTDDGVTEVSYLLIVVGSFNGDWLPSDPGSPTTMTMDTWEMSAGESGAIQNISCEGDGDFINNLNGLDNDVVIEVTLQP